MQKNMSLFVWEMVACMNLYVFVSVKLCSSCEALWKNIAAFGIQELQTIYPAPMFQIIVLPVLLITVFCLWSHCTCPFVFCSHSAVFSMSQHASMSATFPTGFWFMNPIWVCHYSLQRGALMLNLSRGELPHVHKHHEYSSDNLWPAVSRI